MTYENENENENEIENGNNEDLRELEEAASAVADIEAEDDTMSEEPDIGASLMPLRSALGRFVSAVRANPLAMALRGMLPSHASVNMVRMARQGNTNAQRQIRRVMALAESDLPTAPLAKAARENLFRAAALEDAGIPVEDAWPEYDDLADSLDYEEDSYGEEVGLGLVPFLGGAVAAVLAYMLIKPSVAKAAEDQKANVARVPVSEEAARANLKPSDYNGVSWFKIPEQIRKDSLRQVQAAFNRANPATGQTISYDQLDALHLAILVPSPIRDPSGDYLMISRQAKNRINTLHQIEAAWSDVEKAASKDPNIKGVIKPILVIQPKGLSIPSWAKSIISTAANIAVPGSGAVLK